MKERNLMSTKPKTDPPNSPTRPARRVSGSFAAATNTLTGLGATMTLSFVLPGEKNEIQIRFEPPADDLDLDDDL
jgi:hypothetical protein